MIFLSLAMRVCRIGVQGGDLALAEPGASLRIEEYTSLDLGCGKGRAVLLASEVGFREAVGMDMDCGGEGQIVDSHRVQGCDEGGVALRALSCLLVQPVCGAGDACCS